MAQENEDRFLTLIRQRKRGRLKVYIGMIAGVGKTYRMLQEAHELLRSGIDVRIGLIETHGREETAALVEGLPVIPLKTVFYKGKALREMDLDAILEGRPEVVLIDELAHTNVPGGRHQKRWQDVEEILDNGINVITAFNVQHLESMNDRVGSIAGIEVTETIPDRLLEWADEVVNIDLPADDLIKRMREGKIYKGERIQRALDNYFRPDNILQLRDLALRKVASQVEKKIEKSLPVATRPPVETFMACISTNYEGGRKIIRKTARLADYYQARWFVLYVKTPREASDKIELQSQRLLLKNLHWAKELGAEVKVGSLLETAILGVLPFSQEKNVEIQNLSSADEATVLVDPQKTIWILNNLLINAIRYSPEYEKIVVKAEPENGSVKISVRDRGPGVKAAQRDLLFQPYTRLPGDATEGSGLGLAISKEFVEAMGGGIGLNEQYEEGAEFWVRLRKG